MPILYSAVGLNKLVLSSYALCDGNFEDITVKVMVKISNVNSKQTYAHGRYLFHWILENKYLYFCVTDNTCQRSRAFLFLNEIQRKFKKSKEHFASILAQEMYRYNENYSEIVIRQGELDEINTIGVDTTDSILGKRMLLVENDNNLKYMITTNAEKLPEKAVFSKKIPNLKVVCTGIIITLGLSSVFTNPILYTFVTLLIIALCSFK